MRKYKGNLKDQWIDFKTWLKFYGLMIKFMAPHPIGLSRAMFKYPWMYDLLKVPAMISRHTEGVNGALLKTYCLTFLNVTEMTTAMLGDIFFHPEETVIIDSMVPTVIVRAMGLRVFTPEHIFVVTMPMVDTQSTHKYMDYIENHGLPGDTCSYARITAAAVFANHCPPASCIIASNLPCDSGQAAYTLIQKSLDLPMYFIDVPYNFRDDEGLKIIQNELQHVIDFLEKQTGHKMDWNKLKELCERINRTNEMELESREMRRSNHPPVVGFPPWTNGILWSFHDGGTEQSTRVYEEFHAVEKAAFQKKLSPIKNLRYRVVVWNPPTMMYPHVFNWLERCWGIGVLMDMMSYSNEVYYDTASEDTMLKAVASSMALAPMSRHTRGDYEFFLSQFLGMAEDYRADFIINCNHMGCRNSMAMSGVMWEETRKRNIPYCVVDYELMDTRICSRQGVRDQISNFMRSVMGAEPLDPSLLVIDDADSW